MNHPFRPSRIGRLAALFTCLALTGCPGQLAQLRKKQLDQARESAKKDPMQAWANYLAALEDTPANEREQALAECKEVAKLAAQSFADGVKKLADEGKRDEALTKALQLRKLGTERGDPRTIHCPFPSENHLALVDERIADADAEAWKEAESLAAAGRYFEATWAGQRLTKELSPGSALHAKVQGWATQARALIAKLPADPHPVSVELSQRLEQSLTSGPSGGLSSPLRRQVSVRAEQSQGGRCGPLSYAATGALDSASPKNGFAPGVEYVVRVDKCELGSRETVRREDRTREVPVVVEIPESFPITFRCQGGNCGNPKQNCTYVASYTEYYENGGTRDRSENLYIPCREGSFTQTRTRTRYETRYQTERFQVAVHEAEAQGSFSGSVTWTADGQTKTRTFAGSTSQRATAEDQSARPQAESLARKALDEQVRERARALSGSEAYAPASWLVQMKKEAEGAGKPVFGWELARAVVRAEGSDPVLDKLGKTLALSPEATRLVVSGGGSLTYKHAPKSLPWSSVSTYGLIPERDAALQTGKAEVERAYAFEEGPWPIYDGATDLSLRFDSGPYTTVETIQSISAVIRGSDMEFSLDAAPAALLGTAGRFGAIVNWVPKSSDRIAFGLGAELALGESATEFHILLGPDAFVAYRIHPMVSARAQFSLNAFAPLASLSSGQAYGHPLSVQVRFQPLGEKKFFVEGGLKTYFQNAGLPLTIAAGWTL